MFIFSKIIRLIKCRLSKKDSNIDGGYFNVYKNDKEKYDIVFELKNCMNGKNIPYEQLNLHSQIETLCNIIKSLLYTEENVKDKYFQRLLDIAQTGLNGRQTSLSLANNSLSILKEEILIIEGARIKMIYMKKLFIWSIFVPLFLLILYIIICFIFIKSNMAEPKQFLTYFFTFIGAMIGTNISFGARKMNIELLDLSVMEKDMMPIYVRLIYIGVCACVFVLFIQIDFLKIGILEITAEDIEKKVEIQIFIGIICGLFESKIGINLYNRANNIIKNML